MTTGDFELDAMDSFDYADDYAGDYESGVPEGDKEVDALKSGEDQLDMVARLISGEDVDTSEVKPNRNNVMSSRSIGADGKPDYSSQSESLGEPKQKESPLTEQETLYSTQHNERREQIQQAEQWIVNERVKAQAAYERGDMTYEEFQQREFQMGSAYGELTMHAKDWEIEKYKLERQRDQAYKQLEDRLGDRWSPENRHETGLEAAKFLQDRGIDSSLVADIEEPAIVATVVEAMDAIKQSETMKDEIAGLKAQVRRLKKARGEGRARGQRASQAGVTGDKQTDMINEVAALLAGESNRNGGRR